MRDVPQRITNHQVRTWCVARGLAPDEFNAICMLRTGLAFIGIYFSEPCQVWLEIHMKACDEVFLKASMAQRVEQCGNRDLAFVQLVTEVSALLLERVSAERLLEYRIALRLTHESDEAEQGEKEIAARN